MKHYTGKIAQSKTQIDPKLYRKFILNEHEKPVLYVKLRKAIYGTLKASLSFWTKLTQVIKGMGFQINPYDEFVTNKSIKGSKCTIICHVDDLKISHKDLGVVSDIINNLRKVIGKEAPLCINRGKCHYYLGITLEAENIYRINWWTDASYATHHDIYYIHQEKVNNKKLYGRIISGSV
jgi:Reverse transcriptase (RNA-dependent DNA polymerase)